MLFAILCTDKTDAGAIRAENRSRHLEYLDGFGEKVLLGGPTLAEDGTTPTGSFLLIEAEDRAAAEDFCTNDPYAKAGLFESVVIKPWRKVIANPLPDCSGLTRTDPAGAKRRPSHQAATSASRSLSARSAAR